jgi:hypothetical protein
MDIGKSRSPRNMTEFRRGKGVITIGTGPDPYQFTAAAQEVLALVLQSPELPRRIGSGFGADRTNQRIADHKRGR